MKEELTKSIVIQSERFAYTGPINPESNAGNMFYGEDLAKFLTEELQKRSCDKATYYDEDWGWEVSTGFEDADYRLAIYNDGREPPDENTVADADFRQQNGSNRWTIWISMHLPHKLLGFIPASKQAMPTDAFVTMLKDILASQNITLISITEGHAWAQ